MAADPSEMWQRRHLNGWISAVAMAADGAYHYHARDTATEGVAVPDQDSAPGLQAAQAAADQLVPSHACACDEWANVTPKMLLQVTCAVGHGIAATYGREELEELLSNGTLTFHCGRCDTQRPATAEERAAIRQRLQNEVA